MYKFKQSVFIVAVWAIVLVNKCDAEYVAVFTGELQECCENKFVNVDLHVQNAEGLCLAGSIEVLDELDSKIEVHLELNKIESDGSSNPMMAAMMVLDECLKDSDAPWSGLVEAMGIKDVPIPIDIYNVTDVAINMDSAQPYLTEKNQGLYTYIFMLKFGRDTVACYQGELAIDEA